MSGKGGHGSVPKARQSDSDNAVNALHRLLRTTSAASQIKDDYCAGERYDCAPRNRYPHRFEHKPTCGPAEMNNCDRRRLSPFNIRRCGADTAFAYEAQCRGQVQTLVPTVGRPVSIAVSAGHDDRYLLKRMRELLEMTRRHRSIVMYCRIPMNGEPHLAE